MTKLIITLSLIFSVMHISSLLAEDLVIAAGKEGGGYHKKAEEIAVRLKQRGHDVEVVNYNTKMSPGNTIFNMLSNNM